MASVKALVPWRKCRSLVMMTTFVLLITTIICGGLTAMSLPRCENSLTERPDRIVRSENELRLLEHLYHDVHANPGPGFRVVEQAKGKLHYYNIEHLRERQTERKMQIEDHCIRQTIVTEATSEWSSHLQINKNRKLLYCTITKAASTFLKRLFFAVIKEEVINSPLDVGLTEPSIVVNHTQNIIKMLKSSSPNFVKESRKVLFVRHPFFRIFSAYVDKMFAPNPVYWSLGKIIIKRYRKNPSKRSLRCGHDVTFAEVAAYVVESERTKKNRDMHFVPMHETCKTCQIDYTLIGKMETFPEDMSLFLWNLGQNVSMDTIKNWGSLQEEDAIFDSTFSPFGWKKNIERCMTFHEAAKRIWHKMQIRGIISKHVKMPFNRNSIQHVSAPKFAETLLNARDSSPEVNRQKQEAIRKAFMTLSKDILKKLTDLYKPDFDLFGYERFPENIFPKVPIPDEDTNWVFDLSRA